MIKREGNKMENYWNFNTRAIHYGQTPDSNTRAVSQPIVPAVAYSFENAEDAAAVVTGEKEGVYYGRYGNPTTRVLEKKIAALEGAEDALGVSSGMAAISISLAAIKNAPTPLGSLLITFSLM